LRVQRLNQLLKIARALVIAAACCGLILAESGPATRTVYTISTAYGGGSNGDGGAAADAILNQPEGIAVDINGNIYVADADDHRVRRIAPDGTIHTFAGTGVPGFSGDGGPADAAQLNTPYGISLDAKGNLYIADLSNARVRRVSPDGKISTVAGGGANPAGGNSDGSRATHVKLNAPRNVSVDGNGTLYISDFSGQRIYRVTSDATITTLAGTGAVGLSGDGGSAMLAKLSYPAGIAVDSKGAVYFADSGNKRIRRVYRDSITTVTGSGGVLPVFEVPTGIALDQAGNLYVQDGRATTTRISVSGQISFMDIGGRDISVDLWDRIYTTAGFSALRFMGGTNAVIAGAGTQSFAGDGGPASGARFNAPLGLFRDSSGNLFIADSGNNRIRRINPQAVVATIAGTSAKPSNSLAPTAIELSRPASAVMNGRGELFIAESTGHRIRRIGLDGSMTTIAGGDEAGYKGDGWYGIYSALNRPTALAVDKDDNLYIADTGNNRIRVVKPVGTIYTIAGGGPTDAPDGTMASESQLSEPGGVATDANGNVYVSDTNNDRIRVIDRDGRIRTIADAKSAGLSRPARLRVAANGDLIVCDTGNNRIARVTSDGKAETIAGSGRWGFGGDNGPATGAALEGPGDVLLESDGSILFTDSGNGRIRRLVPDAVLAPPPAAVSKLSVVHGATFQETSVAAGEMVSIFGAGLGPEAGVTSKLTPDGSLETEVAGTQVLFDGRAAPLFYVQDQQVNVQVPFGVSGRYQTDVAVVANGNTMATATLPVKASVPGLLAVNKGAGQAIALNQDGSANSFENPVLRGTVLVLYGTGDGEMNSDNKDGRPANAIEFRTPTSATIGGTPVDVVWAGKAPGLVGLMQVNVRIPADFPHAGILEVLLTVNGETTQKGVTVVVR
jgi:uncharacterized protein (TIGR03437 family)